MNLRKKVNRTQGYNLSHEEMANYIDDLEFWKAAAEERYLDIKYVQMNRPQGSRVKAGRKAIPCSMSKQEFLEEYRKHIEIMKNKYHDDGRRCRYCENRVTYMEGYKSTNISVDRINNSIGYAKGNIVFSCGLCNDTKNQVTIEMCKNIIRVYDEME
tara:strand:- start:32 stop:502 length:471 start_codon:yes stop_codon:yes gene_type:complete